MMDMSPPDISVSIWKSIAKKHTDRPTLLTNLLASQGEFVL